LDLFYGTDAFQLRRLRRNLNFGDLQFIEDALQLRWRSTGNQKRFY
jgi:hypothetical protein